MSQIPGPADLVVVAKGWRGVAPNIFGYGPYVDSIGRNFGPPEGAATSHISSQWVELRGIGALDGRATIGGQTATPETTAGDPTQPSPLRFWYLRPPAGTPGSASISITTAEGAVNYPRGYTYAKQIKIYTVTGVLVDTVYDARRHRVYVTNSPQNRIEVFSTDTHAFLQPIATGQDPRGLDLLPDGSRLLVCNSGNSSISVIDPDTGTTEHIFTIPAPVPINVAQPQRVAGTNTGNALVVVNARTADGYSAPGGTYHINLTSGTGHYESSAGSGSQYVRLLGGSKLFSNGFGVWDSATDTWSVNGPARGDLSDIAITPAGGSHCS